MRSRLPYRLALGVVLALSLANMLIGYDSQRALSNQFEQLSQAKDDLLLLRRVESLLLGAETGQRGYLLTEEVAYRAPYDAALTELDESVTRLKSSFAARPALAARAETLERALAATTAEIAATLAMAEAGDFETAIGLVDEDLGHMETVRAESAVIEQALANEIVELERAAARTRTRTLAVIAVAGVLSITLLGTLVIVGSRHALQTEAMNRQLERQNERLDEKVRSRTRELQDANAQFLRSNRELETFAYVVSHDLQEPLRKIRAFGDRLSARHGEQLDPRAIDYIGRMQSAAQRMSTLLSDLLEFSRVNTRGLKLAEVDLSELFDTVIDDLEVAIERRDAEIRASGLPVVVGDATQLRQLFQNLISNSLKFQPEGQRPKIVVTGSIDESGADRPVAVVRFEDNGIGFEERFLDRIFDPFQRLHGRTAYGGSGIGLAICRRIAERHGGGITATSTPGHGSVFTVRLDASQRSDDLESAASRARGSVNE